VGFSWEMIDGTSHDGRLYIAGQFEAGVFQVFGYGPGFAMGSNGLGPIGMRRCKMVTPSRYFNDHIDEVRLNNRGITDIEVQELL